MENQIKQLKDSLAQQKIENMIQEKISELGHIEDEIKWREGLKLHTKIEYEQKQKDAIEQMLRTIVKTKRNFAIIIQTQKGTVELLRKFSAIVVGKNRKQFFWKTLAFGTVIGNIGFSNKENSIYNLSTVETCDQFMHLYDEKIEELLKESEREVQGRQFTHSFLEPLKQHVLSLPEHLSKQLLEKMRAISQDVLDPETGILEPFEGLSISKETTEFLKHLNDQILAAARNSLDVNQTIEAIKRDLSLLAQFKIEDQPLDEKKS